MRISIPDPNVAELQRLLKPLALNNSSLRQTIHVLQKDASSSTMLKRMRALRDQNQDITSAVTVLLSELDQNDSTTAKLKSSFKPLLNDFSALYASSLRTERVAVSMLLNSSPSMSLPSLSMMPARFLSISKATGASSPQRNSSDYEEPTVSAFPKSSHTRSLSLELHATPPEEHVSAPWEVRSHSRARSFDSSPSTSDTIEYTPLLVSPASPSQPQRYQSLDLREQILSDRRLTMQTNKSAIEDVSSIFKDINNDQRLDVGLTDTPIGSSSSYVASGQRELIIVSERRNRGKPVFLYIFLSIAVIVAIFVIIVFC